MEKELFRTTLLAKAQAANNNAQISNLSERTIDEVVSLFLPSFADDSKITDESWGIPVQMIKTMNGQVRHDASVEINNFKTAFEKESKERQDAALEERMNAFKAQWEKDHPSQANGTPMNGDEINKVVEDKITKALEGLTGEDGAIGKLGKTMTDFIKGFNEQRTLDAINKTKAALKEYLIDERLATREPVVNLAIKEVEIKEDSDINTLKVLVEKKYEELYKDFYGDAHSSPFAGGGGGTGSETDAEFQSFIEERKKGAQAEAEAAEALKKNLV